MSLSTADLCDAHEDRVQVCDPILRDYGGRSCFSGPIATIKCFEDNSRVRERLATQGGGRVLVVDAGGSLRCAMLGELLAETAAQNHWAGVILFGCIRDSVAIARMDLGVKALATHPRRSVKRDEGVEELVVCFAGVHFTPGQYVYCDEDGILVSSEALG